MNEHGTDCGRAIMCHVPSISRWHQNNCQELRRGHVFVQMSVMTSQGPSSVSLDQLMSQNVSPSAQLRNNATLSRLIEERGKTVHVLDS